MDVESAGEPNAKSSRGALGLMQLMPATWLALRVQLGLGAYPFSPHDNVIAGTSYLRQMWDRYGMPGALAAYCTRHGRWKAYIAGARPLPSDTLDYIASLASCIGTVAVPAVATNPEAEQIGVHTAPIFVNVDAPQMAPTEQNEVIARSTSIADNVRVPNTHNALFAWVLRRIPLHLSASTCMAQNAREARFRTCADNGACLRRRRSMRFSRSNSRFIFNASVSSKARSQRRNASSPNLCSLQ